MRQPEWSSDSLLSKRTHHVPFRLLDTAAVALLTRRPRRLPMITMTPKARLVATLTVAGPWFAVALLILGAAPLLRAQEISHKLTVMDEFQIQTPTDPQISPDGKKIVYVRRFADRATDKRYANLWIINSDGTDHRALTTGNRSDSSPHWSPDGTRIAYLSDADGKTQIYIRWMDTGQTARITDLEDSPEAIAWSPDGKMLSFSALVPGKGPHIADLPAPPAGAKWADPPKAYDQLVYRFNGVGSHSLSDNLDRDIQGPEWAPDNSGVFFQYADQGDTKIGFCTNDGNCKKIADHVASTTSAYGGGSFSIARTGLVAMTYGRTDDPGNIAVLTNGAMKLLTSLNQELLAQKKPGHVEEISYESSKDKRKIQGWIVHPPDFDASKKYPLILEIHGGPFADYGDRFDFEKQVWASMGYVVLYTNPRGSTSYGEEFANLIHHAYPGDDFDDLNSGVDAVAAKGYIDTNNLFVTGGSGGGVLTCWTIEHTDRFRAATSLYPVINWYSFALTSDIPWVAQYWFPGNPWDNIEQYMQRSLTNLVAKVKTPTMVMTGEADYRTPIPEAEQFYEALKLLNIDSVLVRVPEEPHGISRRPSHHIDKMLYVAGWFEQHKAK